MIKERLQKLAVELGHPPQAYLYARISREDYKDETNPQHAIESQLSILRRVVSENNLNVYKEKAEIESGVTAEDAQREILELIKSRTINILIIKDECVIITQTRKKPINKGFSRGLNRSYLFEVA